MTTRTGEEGIDIGLHKLPPLLLSDGHRRCGLVIPAARKVLELWEIVLPLSSGTPSRRHFDKLVGSLLVEQLQPFVPETLKELAVAAPLGKPAGALGHIQIGGHDVLTEH